MRLVCGLDRLFDQRRLAAVASLLYCVLCSTAAAWAADEEPRPRLMRYRDELGREQPVRTVDDWNRRRAEIIAAFEQVAGPLPAEMHRAGRDAHQPAPLDLQEHSQRDDLTIPNDGPRVRRQKISLASRRGERVPAYVWTPTDLKPGERRAAVVALHPDADQGKRAAAGYSVAFSTQRYAVDLAKRGYIVIAPDYPGFGDALRHDFDQDDYASGTMKGIVDHIRCVDYLSSREDVDPERIGVVGHEFGARNAVFLALYDPRVQAIVARAGWSTFSDDALNSRKFAWTDPRFLPALATPLKNAAEPPPFDFYELAACAAPRPIWTSAPHRKDAHDYEPMIQAAAKVREVYELFGKLDRLRVRYFVGAGSVGELAECYEFLDEHLRHRPTAHYLDDVPTAKRITIKSTLDDTEQPCDVFVPEQFEKPRGRNNLSFGVLVVLHDWNDESGDPSERLLHAARVRSCLVLRPKCRGANAGPAACGSKLAQQDVLDAVAWAMREYPIDKQRVFLTGLGGGGQLALLMAANYPERWTAVSVWSPITDLVAWHKAHDVDARGEQLRKVCGGAPGESPAIDAEYAARSPLGRLRNAKECPIEIAAGVFDGHGDDPVSVRQALVAFNEIARADGEAPIDDATIESLAKTPWRTRAARVEPLDSERAFRRAVYFQRRSQQCRIRIFDGGHERLEESLFDWYEMYDGIYPIGG